jgi:hypothetical protein
VEGKGPLYVHLGSPQKVCISSRVAYRFVYDKAVTQSLSKKAEESSKGWPLPVTQVREEAGGGTRKHPITMASKKRPKRPLR